MGENEPKPAPESDAASEGATVVTKHSHIKAKRDVKLVGKESTYITERSLTSIEEDPQATHFALLDPGQGVEAYRASLQEAAVDEDAEVDLVSLIKQAKDLEDVTRDWSIYEEVWEQTYTHEHRDFRRRAIQAGQDMVEELYKSVIDAGITQLKRAYETITVIPFFNRMTAGGFDSPAPYITTPRWGYTHPWNWSTYAHEVGHHIYRNVIGWQDELKVNIAHHLMSQGHDYSMVSLWYNWNEEIFSDVFGLLQMGPAYARTPHYAVLISLPRRAMRHLLAANDPTTMLRHAYDFSHPTPYLRVYLTWKALELSALADPSILSDLRGRWYSLFDEHEFFGQEVGDLYIQTFELGEACEISVESEKEYAPRKLAKIGDQVLQVILETKLYSLADAQETPRCIQDLFTRTLLDLPADLSSHRLVQDPRDIVRLATDCFETEEMESLNGFRSEFIGEYQPRTS